jgi:CRISPR-associated exonuclease Cas4
MLEPLPLSLVNDFLYCPRRAALKGIEGYREENVHTVLGDALHEHADLPGYEVAKGVLVWRALPVWSDRLGLSGKCDIVEKHPNGSLAPVEYKKGRRRRFDNDDAQLCAQVLCLEEMFHTTIERGAVFHAASKRRREVLFTPQLRSLAEDAVRQVHRLIDAGDVPIAEYKPACEECSLFEVARDHLTLQVEVPVFPPELPSDERTRERAVDWRKLSIPIHHLESICAFGTVTLTAPALALCWDHGVAVHYLTDHGYLQARLTGVADTSVTNTQSAR